MRGLCGATRGFWLTLAGARTAGANPVAGSTPGRVYSGDVTPLRPPEGRLGLAVIVQVSLTCLPLPGQRNVMPLVVRPAVHGP